MEIYRIEGVILQTLPFGNYDQIITVFTDGEGVCKFLVKGAYSSKYGKGGNTAPLTRAEFDYTKGKSELYLCRGISIIDQHLHIRQNLSTLEAACDMLKTILVSQLTEKPASELYQLLMHYLGKLPQAKDPGAISASFRLKTLRYEGLIRLEPVCSHCGSTTNTYAIAEGECFCREHAPYYTVHFNQEESALLEQLAYSKHFSQLAVLCTSSNFSDKIKQLFQASIGK